LAVIHEGACFARLSAFVGGGVTSYNTVYCVFENESEDTITLADTTWADQVHPLFSDVRPSCDFVIRYYFLNREDADYSGMARRYRRYLEEELGLKRRVASEPRTVPIYLRLEGAVLRRKSVAGLPITVAERLTAAEQVREITGRLQSSGVTNIWILLSEWSRDALAGRIPDSSKIVRTLGSRRERRNLALGGPDQGVTVVPSVDFIRFERSGNGVNRLRDAARSAAGGAARQYEYLLSTTARDISNVGYLLTPPALQSAFGRYLAGRKGSGATALMLESLGSTVYSDLRGGDPTDRDSCRRLVVDVLAEIDDAAEPIIVQDPNDYALPYADVALSVPLTSSGFDIESYPVPFLPMVLHGYVDYAGPPINAVDDPASMLLHLLATGAYPYYHVIGEDTAKIPGSDADHLFSAGWRYHLGSMVDTWRTVQEALGPVHGRRIVHHSYVAEGVSATRYEGGTAVLVNFSTETADVNGTAVPARGYRVVLTGAGD
jgi:hypothetical protein